MIDSEKILLLSSLDKSLSHDYCLDCNNCKNFLHSLSALTEASMYREEDQFYPG